MLKNMTALILLNVTSQENTTNWDAIPRDGVPIGSTGVPLLTTKAVGSNFRKTIRTNGFSRWITN